MERERKEKGQVFELDHSQSPETRRSPVGLCAKHSSAGSVSRGWSNHRSATSCWEQNKRGPGEPLGKKGKEKGLNVRPEFLCSGQADSGRAAGHFSTGPQVNMPDLHSGGEGGWKRGSP